MLVLATVLLFLVLDRAEGNARRATLRGLSHRATRGVVELLVLYDSWERAFFRGRRTSSKRHLNRGRSKKTAWSDYHICKSKRQMQVGI